MITRFSCTFIFLCAIFTANKAQGIFRHADSLFVTGNYRNAAIEYERVIYLTNDLNITNHSVYNKAICYKNLGEYSKACQQLLRISYFGTSDSAQFLYHFEMAGCSFLAGKFEDTHSQLLQIRQYTKDSSFIKKILLLEALNNDELGDYSAAKESLTKYFEANFSASRADSLKHVFADYYSRRGLPRIKSQKLAEILEYLPGLGLLYAGYPVMGAFNFLLNAVCLTGGVYEIYYGFYFTGYFAGAAVLSKFYFGGRSLTEKMIVKRNYIEKRRFNDKVRNQLSMSFR
jgi:tetratricopeptide (TPR) repeat protein